MTSLASVSVTTGTIRRDLAYPASSGGRDRHPLGMLSWLRHTQSPCSRWVAEPAYSVRPSAEIPSQLADGLCTPVLASRHELPSSVLRYTPPTGGCDHAVRVGVVDHEVAHAIAAEAGSARHSVHDSPVVHDS